MPPRLKKWAYLSFIIALACLLIYLFPPDFKKKVETTFYCGAEEYVIEENDTVFVHNGLVYRGGKPTNKEAFRGDFSAIGRFPFSHIMHYDIEVAKGNVLKASIWKKGGQDEAFIAVSDNNESIFCTNLGIDSISKNGWEKLSVTFVVPPCFDKKRLRVGGYCKNTQDVFFDELSIEVHDTLKLKDITSHNFKISLTPKDAYNLQRELKNLCVANIKPAPDYQKYQCSITTDTSTFNAFVSINSHHYGSFENGKWSLKVENERFTFLLSPPVQNNFMNEWWGIKLLNFANATAQQISFGNLAINDLQTGIHQIKCIPKMPHSVEIFWSEEGTWGSRKIKEFQFLPHDNFHVEVDGNPSYIVYKNALKAVNTYNTHSSSLTSQVNIDQLAKFYAISNLINSMYALTIQNFFYRYDTIAQNLSIVPLNLFNVPGSGSSQLDSNNVIYGKLNHRVYNEKNVDFISSGVLNDPTFLDRYVHFLTQYSSEEFLNTFKKAMSETANQATRVFNSELTNKESFWDRTFQKAAMIRSELASYSKQVKERKHPTFKPYTPPGPSSCEGFEYIPDLTVKVWKDLSKKSTYIISNFHCEAVTLLGWGNKDQMLQKLSEPVLIKTREEAGLASQIVEPDFEYAYFKVEGKEAPVKEKVHFIAN